MPSLVSVTAAGLSQLLSDRTITTLRESESLSRLLRERSTLEEPTVTVQTNAQQVHTDVADDDHDQTS
jgi:hypothetical protein